MLTKSDVDEKSEKSVLIEKGANKNRTRNVKQ